MINDTVYDVILNTIRKHYRKNKNILELYLNGYEGYHIYVRLDYLKKKNIYKLIWFDFDLVGKDIESCANYEAIELRYVDRIREIVSKISCEEDEKKYLYNIEFKVNYPTLNNTCLDIAFYRYLPIKYSMLVEIFIILFKNLPKKLEMFFAQILAEVSNSKIKYDYKKKFTFDLYNDDVDKIFNSTIVERGRKYYEDGKVKFLEKIDNRYFAIVEGTFDYVVIVSYNEENKEMQLYCSCPCEFFCKHIYAVIIAIRSNESKRFYKISYKKPNVSIIQRILEFDYKLCLRVLENNFIIINDYGQVELVPILDINNQCNWVVLEDDENEYLAKYIQKAVHGELDE